MSIPKEIKLTYFENLGYYALDDNLIPFTELITILEEEQLDKYIADIKATKK